MRSRGGGDGTMTEARKGDWPEWDVPGWDWDKDDYSWLSSKSGIHKDGTSHSRWAHPAPSAYPVRAPSTRGVHCNAKRACRGLRQSARHLAR